jgi:DNA-binding Lrp family transcriptional regulator
VERIVEQIRSWLASGIIRRFGAVVEHRSLGFRANGMAVFRAAAARADEIGRSLAAEPAVSHCYRRPALPDFPYNLYARVHGRSEEEVRDIVRRMAEAAGVAEYEVLFSVTEFKKSPPAYFSAEGGPGEAADAD